MRCAVELVDSHRLYVCALCGEQVHICRRCDRGQIYCAGECAAIRRHDSRRRAALRYQASHHGALRHAARQRRWRAREQHAKQKVTHQGSPGDGDVGTVAAPPTASSGALANAYTATRQRPLVACRAVPVLRCTFCGCTLSPFVRVQALRRRL
jgi:hypothetical protein